MTGSVHVREISPAVAEFLASPDQWGISLSGTGAVYRLERKFSSLIGHPHALAVPNATLGLWAILRALDIHDSDVITTPYTWGGSLSGLFLARNRPVFADIDRNSLTLDPQSVVSGITPKTRAILAVDIYGYPCHGQALRKLAEEYGLLLIQDSAQSFGAYIGKRHTGWWADASVFSFTYGKALFAGEGAMIVTRHQDLFDRLVWQTQHPLRQLRDIPHVSPNEMGINLRINPLAAVCAEAAFDSTLVSVDKNRTKYLKILHLLQSNQLSNTKTPNLSVVRPSFNTLTFEPAAKLSKIDQLLREHMCGYRFCSPPIVEPLYCHEFYKEASRLNGWNEPRPCPVVAEQCRRRLRILTSNIDRRGVVAPEKDGKGENGESERTSARSTTV